MLSHNEEKDAKYLEASISFYSRGFFIKRDYYNGIYNVRADTQEDINEAITDTHLGILPDVPLSLMAYTGFPASSVIRTS